MQRILRIALYLILVIVLLIPVAIWQRHQLIVNLYKKNNAPLLAKVDEGSGVVWFDDYYTIQELADGVFAIGEPRYWQRNYNYLIIGTDRALLVDAGPGVRDIRTVVASLTGLPITLVTTHFHFDHQGDGIEFDNTAVVDLPHLRDRATGDVLQLTNLEHLGKPEGFTAPSIKVGEWFDPADNIDLGGRKISAVYTPGHTVESVSFYDATSNIFFTGDWFTKVLGPMFANSNMGDYALSLENALCKVPMDARIFGAHKYEDGDGAPELKMADIEFVAQALPKVRSKEIKSTGIYPAVYELSDEFSLYTDIVWLQNWDATYPDLKAQNCVP